MEEQNMENPFGVEKTPEISQQESGSINETEQVSGTVAAESFASGNPETEKPAIRELMIGKIISLSWESFKKNLKFSLWLILAYFAIRVFEAIIQEGVRKASLLSLIAAVAIVAVNIFISIGIIKIFLKLSRGSEAKIGEIFGERKYFWKFLGGSIIYVLTVLVGYLLLIVPGIIWQYKYNLTPYLIVDKDLDPLEAMKESGKMTYGFKWKMFLLQLSMIPIILLGIICLGIGVSVSIVVVTFMSVFTYRILAGEKI